MSVLTWSSGANIVYPVCFIFEKDELHYSQYGSLKHENLIRCELSSGEVSLERAMIDNLVSDDPSLVVATKRLKIMISYKDQHSTDVLYHQRCYNKFTRDYKSVESDRKDKGSVQKATSVKRFLTLLKTQVINQKSCFPIWDLLIEINNTYAKNGC